MCTVEDIRQYQLIERLGTLQIPEWPCAAPVKIRLRPFSSTPTELVTEMLLFGCGNYFDADSPFSDNAELRLQFVRRRSTFRSVSLAWRQIIDGSIECWSSHVVAPKQSRASFNFITAKMTGAYLHMRVVLRGPGVCIPPPRPHEIGILDIVKLLRSNSNRWSTLGIYSEDRPLFRTLTDDLTGHPFPRLRLFALVNIERVPTGDLSVRFQPAPNLLHLEFPGMRHVLSVGFALSFRCPDQFRNITTLVLADLDHVAAPSMDELYRMLKVATGLEALSVERMWNLSRLDARAPLILHRLKKLHFHTAGNTPFEQLLLLLRAPNISQLDVKIVVSRDWDALLMCGDLVRSVVMLRIYGVRRPEIDFGLLSNLMPHVLKLDVSNSDESLAQDAITRAFRWTKLDTLHMRAPRFESIRTILTAMEVASLHVRYVSPSHSPGHAGSRWISTKVGSFVVTLESDSPWYSTMR